MASQKKQFEVNVNGRSAENSLESLKKEAKRLNAEIKKLPRNSKKFADKSKQLQDVNGRMRDMQSEIRGSNKAFEGLKQEVKNFGVVAIGALGAGVITDQISQIIDRNAKLADAFADVQKTTGLTRKEVEALNGTFSDMDTRTARMDLLQLARDAGKLGITGKENVNKFVQAANQVNVALGEDLGKGAIKQLGKINDAFQISDAKGYKDAMMATGSAINALGMASTAQESFLVNFTSRLQGVATQADISVSKVLGLAGTMDSLGARAESSSTAIQKALLAMLKNTSKFAQTAGLDVQEFSKLVRKDANEALLKWVESLKNNSATTGEMSKKLDQLGLGAERSAKVMLMLANNTDKVREQQDIANKEFEKGTSLTEEYNIKNENFAATLKKLQREIRGLVFNASITDFFKGLIQNSLSLIRTLKANGDVIKSVIKAIGSMTAAWLSYKAALIAADLKSAALSRTLRSRVMRSLVVVRKGFRALTTAMKSNPWAWIAGTIGGVVTSLTLFSDKLFGAAKAQQAVNNAMEDYNKKVAEQTSSAKALFTQLENTNKGTQRRRDLIDEVNARYGKYLQSQLSEEANLKDIKAARSQVIKGMKEEIALKSQREQIQKILNEQHEREKGLLNEIERRIGHVGNASENFQDVMKSLNTGDLEETQNKFKALNRLVELRNKGQENAAKTLKEENDLSEDTIQKFSKIRDLTFDQESNSMGMNVQTTTLNDKLSETITKRKEDQEAIDSLRNKFDALIGKQEELNKQEELTSTQKALIKQYAAATDSSAEFTQQMLAQAQAWKENQEQADKSGEASRKALDKIKRKVGTIEELDKVGVEPEIAPKLDTDETLEEWDKMLAKRSKEAKLELNIASARNPEEEKQARLEKLQWEKEQELKNKALTENERLMIEKKYANKRQKVEQRLQRKKRRAASNTINEIGSQFSKLFAIQNQLHRNRMQNIRNEKKEELRKLEQQKQRGIISEQEFQAEKGKLQEKFDKRLSARKREQARLEKKQALFEATINGTKAFISALARGGPVLAATVATLTAAKVAAIARKPIPEFAQGGKMKDKVLGGRSHRQGGNPVIDGQSGQQIAEVEEGEPILSKKTYENNKPIVDRLLQSSKNEGGKAITPWMYQKQPQFDLGGIFKTQHLLKYQTGGSFQQGDNKTQQQEVKVEQDKDGELKQTLNQLQSQINALAVTLRSGISVNWQQDDTLNLKDEIQELNQNEEEGSV